MAIPEQDFMYLEELIRKVDTYLSGDEKDGLEYLYSKDLKQRLYGKNPKCFIAIKGIGREFPTLLPLCNRAGIKDPRAMNISKDIINKLMSDSDGVYDSNALTNALAQLDRMYNVYSKDVPTPPNAAGKKAHTTRMMNKIKKHLDLYKGN